MRSIIRGQGSRQTASLACALLSFSVMVGCAANRCAAHRRPLEAPPVADNPVVDNPRVEKPIAGDPVASDPAAAQVTTWPLAFEAAGGRVEVYQPQPDSLNGDKFSARAAVSLQPAGSDQPTFGAIWIDARLVTDRDKRTATLEDIQVKEVRLPEVRGEQQQQFMQAIRQRVPMLDVTFALDQLMTSLNVAEKQSVAEEQLRTNPPNILFSTVPATLVSIDGEPKLQPVDQSPLMRVVNTPFLILFEPETKRYFLKAGASWVISSNVSGPYEDAPSVPANVTDVATGLQQRTTANGSATPEAPAPAPSARPRIIVATDPTELIVTDGEPDYTPLPGNDLLYVSNTQSDVFLEVSSQQTYLLLSGRWYRAKSRNGPWEFVASDRLPAAFTKIPADSPKADVLAFVAETQQAKEAVLGASVPQTSAIRRDAGANLKVTYDGPPKFEPIEGTSMTYAVNTADPIILVNGTYYCCSAAVWYQAPSAEGPWDVCVAVPPEVYTIPPSSPIYNVRYVYVYDHGPDVVYVGYLPGYAGCYVYGPTVVYGTGYRYRGWYGSVYYPGPYTWGFGACFDPWNDSWGFGVGFYWGPDWFWHDRYHHRWFGPGGYRDYRHFHDRGYAHFDGRDYDGHRNIYNRAGNDRRNAFARRDDRVARFPGRGENNVFAGHDGSVYRRTNDGWEARSDQSWAHLRDAPENRAPERDATAREGRPAERGLEADRAARERGAARAGMSPQVGSRGGGGGDFRGGGGAGGGGGGGRRR